MCKAHIIYNTFKDNVVYSKKIQYTIKYKAKSHFWHLHTSVIHHFSVYYIKTYKSE